MWLTDRRLDITEEIVDIFKSMGIPSFLCPYDSGTVDIVVKYEKGEDPPKHKENSIIEPGFVFSPYIPVDPVVPSFNLIDETAYHIDFSNTSDSKSVDFVINNYHQAETDIELSGLADKILIVNNAYTENGCIYVTVFGLPRYSDMKGQRVLDIYESARNGLHSVRPFGKPRGKVFYFDYIYGDDNNIV